jgi:uncharacterized protein YjaG (DUF416 family)
MPLTKHPEKIMNIVPGDMTSVRDLMSIDFKHQVLFGASVCERSLPIYLLQDFDDRFNHDTLPILREMLNYVWQSCDSLNFNPEILQEFLDRCKNINDEIDEQQHYLTRVSVEHYVPTIIEDLINLCLTTEYNYLEAIVERAHGIIMQGIDYTLELESEMTEDNIYTKMTPDDLDKKICEHCFIMTEIEKEIADWHFLKDRPVLTPELIQEFRSNADPEGIGLMPAPAFRNLALRVDEYYGNNNL